MLNVLIIGAGGREHAIAWKVAKSPLVEHVFVAPGNYGTQLEPKTKNVEIHVDDHQGLLQFAKDNHIDLTIVGPEAPLVDGITDLFVENELTCFGPNKKAAQLEGSKVFSKNFLQRHNIPSASYESFNDISSAMAHIERCAMPIVIKADGLAAGKGVIIAEDKSTALQAVTSMLGDNQFGEAGNRIIIEEFLSGEEVSFICMVNGESILPLATSQDHKTRDDGDVGPNTGGMGAYSPAAIVSDELHNKIMQSIIIPTTKGLISDGINYCGFLYAGLMIDKQGDPHVLEYNVRLGDPETQPIMARLKSDLVSLCLATLNKQLENTLCQWDERVALGVVMAAKGYPNDYKRGHIIEGLNAIKSQDSKIFHSATALKNKAIVTTGGRVLCVCALGETIGMAKDLAYQQVDKISWPGAFFRSDIGFKEVKREANQH